MLYRLILLWCCFISTSVVAQTTGKFHIQHYTTENGLPSNGIKGLQWDEATGFLWIATEAGIVRFNGVEYRSFTKKNMPAIGSERMMFMTRNFKGKICISDLNGNIFNIEKNKPVLWKKAKPNTNPYYDNYYMLTVSDSFFTRYANDRVKVSGFSSVTDKIVSINDTTCFILNGGSLYYQHISLNGPALLPFEKKGYASFFKIDDQCFVVDKRKTIFLLNTLTAQLNAIPVKDEEGNPFKADINYANLFWEPGMKSPIYISEGKAWELTQNSHSLIAKLIFTGIPPDAYIKSVQYSKKNKTLFIGTDSKGLIILNQNLVESKKRKVENSKNRNSYYAQIELNTGNILTNEGDIIGESINQQQHVPIKGKFAFHVTGTGDSLIWFFQINTSYGHPCMFNYNKLTGKTKGYPGIKAESIVTSSEGNIWVANNTGIYQLKGDSLEVKLIQPKGASGNPLFSFTEISPGVLVLASCSGLFRFKTATQEYDTLYTNKDYCVRSIWNYKDNLFFGTYGGGFYVYKNGLVKAMPLDKNKYLLYTHCFIPDNKGFCWISTNRGLFKANIEELIKAAESNVQFVYYHYFGKKDGMEMTELNGGCSPCALVKKDLTISFPSMDGLLWVNPTMANPVLPEGEIFIDEVLADNITEENVLNKIISLPAKTGELVFRLAYSAWCNKENIYIEYQLNDGENWKMVNLESGSEIRFNNLPSGKYTLNIRKLNGFGFNNYTTRQIVFEIVTPWFKQWWFYLLSGIAGIGLIYLFIKKRTQTLLLRQQKLEKLVTQKTTELQEKNDVLEKSNNINTRLISIISHDIITPLKFLNVAGKNLLEKKALMTEELKDETIKEITTTSKELQLLSTNILNWIKYQNENRRLAKEKIYVHEMVDQVFSVLNSLALQKNIHLNNNVPDELVITEYYEPLKILIYNLLTNAINFSNKGFIKVSAIHENRKTIISVQDEGVGMTPDQIKNIMADQFIVSSANIDNKKGNGLGYLIIKDLVKMMGANLSIESLKVKGTTVYIELEAHT